MLDCAPTLVVTPLATAFEELVRFAEDRDLLQLGPVDTVGKYCERASRISARASIKFSKNTLMVWLLMFSCSSSEFNSGSWNTSHQLPRSIASCGCATVQVPIFGSCCGCGVGASLYAVGAWVTGA